MSASAVDDTAKVGEVVKDHRGHVLESVGLSHPFVGVCVDHDAYAFFFEHHVDIFSG